MTDICGSASGVQRAVQSAGWRRIGVDGVEGAGQVGLAEELAQELQLPLLNLDDYLHRHQGGYVDFIDYPALAAALAAMPGLILCGMCLRQVLTNLGTELDGQVYVMRMRQGEWADEEDCVFPDGVDAAIENMAGSNVALGRHFDEPTHYSGFERDEESLQLAFEVMRYHAEYVPQETADLIYEHGDRG